MVLAFYKVNNSLGYERHTFDDMYDNPKGIKEMLSKLKDGELKMYNLGDAREASFFQEDYNDEEMDGGWWCVLIR